MTITWNYDRRLKSWTLIADGESTHFVILGQFTGDTGEAYFELFHNFVEIGSSSDLNDAKCMLGVAIKAQRTKAP